MERTERFYKIQNLLRSRHFVSAQDFMAELGVSRATFKRDLEYLRDRMHAPIVFDRDQEAYRFDPAIADSELWQLPGLWFSADELQALLTMDRLLGDLQPGVLSELIAPLRKRLKSLLESGEHSAEDIARRIKILSMGSRRVTPAHFRTIATAVLTRKRLKLRHQRRQDGEVIEREVSPQRLVHYRDNWYLDAFCHKRQALRTFGLDAIESALVVPDKDVKEIGRRHARTPLRERLRHLRRNGDTGRRAAVRREQCALGIARDLAPGTGRHAATRRHLPAAVPVFAGTRTGHGHPEVRCGRRGAGAGVTAQGGRRQSCAPPRKLYD